MKIKIKAGIKYLAQVPEFQNGLPKDCLFNKARTGCGATTIALTDSSPTIVCMPTVELITNKVRQSVENPQYPYKLLNVHGNRTVENEEYMDESERYYEDRAQNDYNYYIKEYMMECYRTASVPKILVTYNSLEKLVEVLKVNGAPSDRFNLVVDEYHMLLTEYHYTSKNTEYLLKNFRIFKHFTFLTATPVQGKSGQSESKRLLLEELKGISVVEAEWETPPSTVVVGNWCKAKGDNYGSVKDVLYISICRCLQDTVTDYHLYIFVNSVKFINDMIIKNDLDPVNCRVVYSRYQNHPLANGIERGSTMDIRDDPKKINFLTSTAYEGSDIYDPKGIPVVVSNVQGYTSTDVGVKLPQIAGRLRDSVYGHTIYHFYQLNKANDLITEADFEVYQQAELASEKAKIGYYTNAGKIEQFKNRLAMGKQKLKYHRIDEETQQIIFVQNMLTSEFYQWLANSTYNSSNTVEEETKQAAFANVVTHAVPPFVRMDNNEFSDSVQMLHRIGHNQGEDSWDYVELRRILCEKYPFLDTALTELKFQRIEKMRYRQDEIQRQLKNKVLAKDVKEKLIRKLYAEFPLGSILSANEVKERIKAIYSSLGIKRTAVATHLREYFEINKKTIRKQGIKGSMSGIIIVAHRFNIDHELPDPPDPIPKVLVPE